MATELKFTRDLRRDNWLNLDGSFTQRNATGDLYYKNHMKLGDGDDSTLRKVDVTPVENEAGWLVQFAPYNAQIPLMSDTMLQFVDVRFDGSNDKQMPINVECVGIGRVKGELIGHDIVYANAYGAGAHLVYQVQRHGVAKFVRIDPDSAVTGPFKFRLYTDSKWSVVRQGKEEYELLRTSAKVLDSSKRTVFRSAKGETYIAPYRWRSGPDGDALPVTIEYINNGVWEIAKQLPAEWTREYPLDMDVVAASTASSDGYLAHSGAVDYSNCASGAGVSIDTTAVIMQNYHKGGASGTRNCQRPFMIFANAVPGTATITSVNVKVASTSLTKLNSGVNHTIMLTRFLPADYASPVISDFGYTTGMPSDTVGYPSNVLSVASPAAYHEFNASNGGAIANITKGGYSGWALRNYSICSGPSYVDLYLLVNGGTSYNSTTAGFVFFESANAGGSFPPVEEITYTAPPSGGGNMMMGVG